MVEAVSTVLEGDPILGRVVANYPSNRGRRLITAGIACAIIGALITLALWDVEASTAGIITIAIMAVVGLVAGWYVLHTWNREVILYERGFSYREGSNIIYFLFEEVRTIRQRAERLRYGGLIRRDVYTVTVKTIRDETIQLDGTYQKIGELGERLEIMINRALYPAINARLTAGERVIFGKLLALTAGGLESENSPATDTVPDLAWGDLAGFKIEARQLQIYMKGQPERTLWLAIPLAEIDNLVLLLDILKEKSAG